MNFRWKFRFRRAINEHLSEEVIPHETRDNTTAPAFQNCGGQRAAMYHCKRFALCLQPRLYISVLWNSFFSISRNLFWLLSKRRFQWALLERFLNMSFFVRLKISRVSKIYCLPSTQKEVHWNSVHVAASQQCFISSRNTRCFSSSRFEKETFGGFSIQSVNRH